MTADTFCRQTKPMWPVLAALLALAVTMSVARGDEAPPAPPAPSVDDRLKQLEDRAQQLDTMSKRVQELESEIGTLKGKLKTYENPDAARIQSSPAATSQPAVMSAPAQSPHSHDFATDNALTLDAAAIPSSYGNGLDLNFWTWLQYQRADEKGPDSWWAAEFELDITKSFGDRLSAAADVQLVEESDDAHAEIEQAFFSVLLAPENGTILTVGKFNAPWGIEARDYWDRTTGTISLLFRAQPQDLTGVMLTHPLGKSGIILRPFAALGFDDMAGLNDSLAGGLMIEYRPSDALSLAATGWYGPGVAAPTGPIFPWSSSIWTLTNAWNGPHFESDGGHVQFLDLSANWRARRDLTLGVEYLTARSRNPGEDVNWNGVLVLINYDIDDRWRVFTHYSYLHDPDGAVTELAQRRHAAAIGLGFHPYRNVDFSIEYRYDATDAREDVNTVTVNGSFGF